MCNHTNTTLHCTALANTKNTFPPKAMYTLLEYSGTTHTNYRLITNYREHSQVGARCEQTRVCWRRCNAARSASNAHIHASLLIVVIPYMIIHHINFVLSSVQEVESHALDNYKCISKDCLST